jgi:hypothetical protein
MNAIRLGLACIFFVIGCGKAQEGDGDRTSISPVQPPPDTIQAETPRPQTIKLADNLPYPCDSSVQGNIIFVKGSGFRVCSPENNWDPIDLKGDAGMQGPQGMVGPTGGSSLVAVYDSQDRKIGWLVDSSRSTIYGSGGALLVLLTAGAVVEIFPNGYIYGVFQSDNCYFTSTDCSGTCRTKLPSVIIKGPQSINGVTQYPTSMFLSSINDLGVFNHASRGWPTQCASDIGTFSSSFVVLPK